MPYYCTLIRIYVDVVINHMTWSGAYGTGTAGSSFDARSLDFPGVPYSSWDFNCCNCDMCGTSNCEISDYDNVNEV